VAVENRPFLPRLQYPGVRGRRLDVHFGQPLPDILGRTVIDRTETFDRFVRACSGVVDVTLRRGDARGEIQRRRCRASIAGLSRRRKRFRERTR
jgi:hypothetical protein